MASKPPFITILEKTNQNGDTTLAAIFLLGAAEVAYAALTLLLIGSDPKNAALFGYSLQRVGLFIFACFLGIILLFLANRIFRSRTIWNILDKGYSRHTLGWLFTSFVLALVGCILLISPASLFSSYAGFFERLRPLLVVIAFFPAQLSLRWVNIRSIRIDWQQTRYMLITISIMAGFIVFVAITRFGITPEIYFWNVAGIPITSLQVLLLLLFSTIIAGIFKMVRKSIPQQNIFYLDIVIFLGLYLCAFLVWENTPMVKHFVSLQPRSPYYQPFPYADAGTHDLGAISIIKGWGINFGEYTDKPFYMIYLAVLHLFSGYDYNLIVQSQLFFLAFIPALLYILGKSFHSRFFGFATAILIIIRQRNAILLSHLVASTNPRLLLTELPTMLAMIVFVGLIFLWMKNQKGNPWVALAAGATLGATALIRLNPIIMMPAIPFITLIVMWKEKKQWLIQSAIFTASFIIMVSPWIITGTNSIGQPYFFIKFMDVINTRYQPETLNPNAYLELASSETFLGSLQQNGSIPAGTAVNQDLFIDISHFPGFVLNHFFHNLIESFLSLPDSANPADQDLRSLTTRLYWVENGGWTGDLQTSQLPFILANIFVVALGISWSWKRWKWSGLAPVLVFLMYLISLGLARNSGSRYLVPVDWIIIFYYVLGLVLTLSLLSKLFEVKPSSPDASQQPGINQTGAGLRFKKYLSFSIILFILAFSVPVANKLIPGENYICAEPAVPTNAVQLLGTKSTPDEVFIKGEVLYPVIKGKHLKFVLLSCKHVIPLVIENFVGSIDNGQLILVGLSTTQTDPNPEIMISLKNDLPQILWKKK